MNLKSIDKRLLTILLIVLVHMIGSAMIIPILPLYALREFSLTPQVITLLSTAFFAAQFLAGPFLGRLSDRHGRVPILIFSQIGTVISYVMLALAPSGWMLFLARVMDGITGGNIIVAQAYVTDITEKEKRTEALGYISALFGIGFIIGPAVGGILSAAFGPRMPYLIAAAAATIPAIMTWRLLDETVTGEQQATNRRADTSALSAGAVIRNSPLVIMLVVGFVAQFAAGLLQSTFPLYGEVVLFEGAPPETANLGIGLMLALVGFGQLITQALLLPRLIRRFTNPPFVIAGSLLRVLSLAGFAVLSTPYMAGASALLYSVGSGILLPPLQSMVTTTVADDLRGGVLGLFQSSASLAIIISTAVSGLMFAVAPEIPFWVGAGLSLIAALPALTLLRGTTILRPARELARQSAD